MHDGPNGRRRLVGLERPTAWCREERRSSHSLRLTRHVQCAAWPAHDLLIVSHLWEAKDTFPQKPGRA